MLRSSPGQPSEALFPALERLPYRYGPGPRGAGGTGSGRPDPDGGPDGGASDAPCWSRGYHVAITWPSRDAGNATPATLPVTLRTPGTRRRHVTRRVTPRVPIITRRQSKAHTHTHAHTHTQMHAHTHARALARAHARVHTHHTPHITHTYSHALCHPSHSALPSAAPRHRRGRPVRRFSRFDSRLVSSQTHRRDVLSDIPAPKRRRDPPPPHRHTTDTPPSGRRQPPPPHHRQWSATPPTRRCQAPTDEILCECPSKP